jgi:hypothetical protein
MSSRSIPGVFLALMSVMRSLLVVECKPEVGLPFCGLGGS